MRTWRSFFAGVVALSSAGSSVWAAAINTDTALPVHQGEVLWREQVKFFKFEDANASGEVFAVPSVLVYGVTSKFALIGVAPYFDKTLRLDSGIERGANGLGDVTLLGRYEAFQWNPGPGKTMRVQLLGGLKFPTGQDDERDGLGRLPPPLQLGTGSFDPVVGGVFTWQTLCWQTDFDLLYQVNTEANDFQFGNRLRHDAAFEYRLLPWQLPEQGVPNFLYGVVELNGIWAERNQTFGRDIAASGGYTLYFSPGLQYVTRRWVAEVSVQFPIVKELGGDAVRADLKADYIINAGFRIQF